MNLHIQNHSTKQKQTVYNWLCLSMDIDALDNNHRLSDNKRKEILRDKFKSKLVIHFNKKISIVQTNLIQMNLKMKTWDRINDTGLEIQNRTNEGTIPWDSVEYEIL